MSPLLTTGWGRLAPRERRALALAGATVGLALVWWVALAPALATLHQAPAQHDKLNAELRQLQALAAQAQALQAQTPLGRDEVLRALEAAIRRHLGPDAQLQATAERATASFSKAEAQALAQWLADVRINARLTPTEWRASVVADQPGTWQGSAVFALPR